MKMLIWSNYTIDSIIHRIYAWNCEKLHKIFSRARKICSTNFFYAVCSPKRQRKMKYTRSLSQQKTYFCYFGVFCFEFLGDRNTSKCLTKTVERRDFRSVLSSWASASEQNEPSGSTKCLFCCSWVRFLLLFYNSSRAKRGEKEIGC